MTRPLIVGLYAALAIANATFTSVALSDAQAQHKSRVFENYPDGKLYSHNGSSVVINIHRGILEIEYLFPRSELYGAGVDTGTILFEGAVDPNYAVSGTAYIFSRQCGEISYYVAGSITPDLRVLRLSGSAPIVKDCRIVGTTNTGRNAKLVFLRDTRPVVE